MSGVTNNSMGSTNPELQRSQFANEGQPLSPFEEKQKVVSELDTKIKDVKNELKEAQAKIDKANPSKVKGFSLRKLKWFRKSEKAPIELLGKDENNLEALQKKVQEHTMHLNILKASQEQIVAERDALLAKEQILHTKEPENKPSEETSIEKAPVVTLQENQTISKADKLKELRRQAIKAENEIELASEPHSAINNLSKIDKKYLDPIKPTIDSAYDSFVKQRKVTIELLNDVKSESDLEKALKQYEQLKKQGDELINDIKCFEEAVSQYKIAYLELTSSARTALGLGPKDSLTKEQISVIRQYTQLASIKVSVGNLDNLSKKGVKEYVKGVNDMTAELKLFQTRSNDGKTLLEKSVEAEVSYIEAKRKADAKYESMRSEFLNMSGDEVGKIRAGENLTKLYNNISKIEDSKDALFKSSYEKPYSLEQWEDHINSVESLTQGLSVESLMKKLED